MPEPATLVTVLGALIQTCLFLYTAADAVKENFSSAQTLAEMVVLSVEILNRGLNDTTYTMPGVLDNLMQLSRRLESVQLYLIENESDLSDRQRGIN
ncbi:hypothetical protein HDV00_003662 [Rhizophlyctis rosea]|nr:hypothetical protein HDV00_003662 [Rhizophlyctis rosea]